MKVVVLLTGQLRTFEMVKYLHMNTLILKYNADVFLRIDICNKYQCEYKNSTDATDINNLINTFILDNYYEEFNKINIIK